MTKCVESLLEGRQVLFVGKLHKSEVVRCQAECWWDCVVLSDALLAGQAIVNPECLKDCFVKKASGGGLEAELDESDPSCFASLIDDVTSKGTCDDGNNPAAQYNATVNFWGWYDLDNNCTLEEVEDWYDYDDYRRDLSEDEDSGSGLLTEKKQGRSVDRQGRSYDYYEYGPVMKITQGTCSPATERDLPSAGCQKFLAEQPLIIKNTLELLVQYSCSADVYESLPFSQAFRRRSGLTPASPRASRDWASQIRRKARRNAEKKIRTKRLAPITKVDISANTKTELMFENTRHRYPWICSLRTKGSSSEHLCAVNLLAVPPNPTVIVGSAHCTYQCKNDKGAIVPSCCCAEADKGQMSCQDDSQKCGTSPKAIEMGGNDAEIVCGEWQTGSTKQGASGEKYNVVLPIVDIIRSPDYNTAGEGPAGGADIAVFKVDDSGFQDSREHKIYPACLPPKDRSHPEFGIHSGWSKPPPRSFLEQYGSGYLQSYEDFFKQWHYKMRIQEKCRDPVKTQAFGQDVKYPSDSYYPPATVCAVDVTSQSCFSTGEAGSPLMVQEESGSRRQRYFIEGLLSFVKGCEQFAFGARDQARTKFELLQNSENPSAYVKLSCHLPWIAEQYGLSYDGIEDETCSKGTGLKVPADPVCRQAPGSDLTGKEYPCIFPFYYNNKGPYNQCMLFEEKGFVFPVFRCPTRNITTKFPGTQINHFEDPLETTQGYCYDIDLAQQTCDNSLEDGGPGCQRLLDPNDESCNAFLRLPPFSTCKNDCPGGDSVFN